MNVFSALKGAFQKKNTLLSADFIDRLKMSDRGVTSESGALAISTVYACVRLISDTVGMLPMNFFIRGEGGSRTEAREHPIAKLMLRPTPWMTPSEFWSTVAAHLAVRGNSLWEKVRVGSDGEIARLRMIHPDSVRATGFSARGDLVYHIIEPGKDPYDIAQRDMFHVRAFSMGGMMGINPIQANAQTLGLHKALAESAKNMTRNGSMVAGVIEYDGELNDDQKRWLKEQWQDQYAGSANAGKTPILEDGFKYKPIGMTAADAQFIEGRQLSKQEVASLWRVPMFLLNDTQKATTWGTGLEQFSSAYHRYTLSPYLVGIEDAFYQSFVLDEKQDENFFGKFNANVLMRGSFQERQFGNQIQAQNGALTVNEWRAMEDRNPVEGGDEIRRAENLYGGDNSGSEVDQNGDAPGTAPPE